MYTIYVYLPSLILSFPPISSSVVLEIHSVLSPSIPLATLAWESVIGAGKSGGGICDNDSGLTGPEIEKAL